MSAARKGAGNRGNRNLPIWMSSRGDTSKSHEEPSDDDSPESCREGGACKKAKGHCEKVKTNTNETETELETESSCQTTRDSSKLLEGVVFVLSGFVNPERGNLRSQAKEMGAEYQPDWNSNSTLLVCAFPNTPKFRQVQAQCGTIVSKEWITECYTQKKLIDIDIYLMHPGKPWRKSGISHSYIHACADDDKPPLRKSQKQEEALKCQQPDFFAQSKASRSESSKSVDEKLPPSEVKTWADSDLNKTIKWLKCQDEKPEPSEMLKVAAGGVLTCLQDAIELLEQKQNVQQLTENWNFLPRVVEELIKMEDSAIPSDTIHKQALSFKKIYEEELSCVDNDPTPGHETRKSGYSNKEKGKGKEVAKNYAGYDSDETIEMTEDEIELGFESIASKKP